MKIFLAPGGLEDKGDNIKELKGPFTQAIFAAIFVAIPNRPCKLAAISWRFRGDLSPQNRRDFEHARILRRFTGDFFSLRVKKTYFGVPPRVVCHKHGGRCL